MIGRKERRSDNIAALLLFANSLFLYPSQVCTPLTVIVLQVY